MVSLKKAKYSFIYTSHKTIQLQYSKDFTNGTLENK